MKNYLPDEMEFCYFQMETGHTCLKLDGSKLIITGPHDDILEPSMDQWISFWEKLEEIGLWGWEEDYDRCCLADGYSWEINISHGNQTLDANGINHGPTRVVADGLVSCLDELLEALEDLSGVEF